MSSPRQERIAKSLEESNRYFNEARDQLDKWADDMILAAEKELDDIKRQIRDLQREPQAPTLQEQHQCRNRSHLCSAEKENCAKKWN